MQPVVQLTQDECLGLMPGGGGAWVVACEICSHRVFVHNGAVVPVGPDDEMDGAPDWMIKRSCFRYAGRVLPFRVIPDVRLPAAALARGFAGEAGAPRGGVPRGQAEPAVALAGAVSLTAIVPKHLAMLRRLPEAAGEQDVTLRPDRLSERDWQRLCRRPVVPGRQRSRLAQALE